MNKLQYPKYWQRSILTAFSKISVASDSLPCCISSTPIFTSEQQSELSLLPISSNILSDYSDLPCSARAKASMNFVLQAVILNLLYNLLNLALLLCNLFMMRIISNKGIYSPMFLTKLSYKISVYQGISPSLLATMSLSQGISGKSNEQLIESLAKNNIVKNLDLIAALKILDRKHFIHCDHSPNKMINYYENKPYKISGGQSMTDIFTHAIILQQACQTMDNFMKQNQSTQGLRLLDIGTGHGYLPFAISAYLDKVAVSKNHTNEFKIFGIDSNNAAIQFSKNLKKKLMKQLNGHTFNNIQFHAQSIEQRLAKNEPYDIIIGGFYMPPMLHQSLIAKLRQSHIVLRRPTFGIWPTDSSSGQSLYRFHCVSNNQHKQGLTIGKSEIMSTMFSMPTIKTSVSKYFVEDGGEEQLPANQQNNTPINQQQVGQRIKLLKIQKNKQQKDKFKLQLKILIDKHTKILNKKLSLNEMKNIPQIKNVLDKLNQR